MRAWHSASFTDLVTQDASHVASELAGAAADRRLAPNPESMTAWLGSVRILQDTARTLTATDPRSSTWSYFFEFEIPRRGRRIDAIVLAHDVIFLIELKIGEASFDRAALWQAEQYALDMRDFHEGSRDRVIVPIVVASAATAPDHAPLYDPRRLVQAVIRATPESLPSVMQQMWGQIHHSETPPFDRDAWENSSYRPTPSIVDAARHLYEHHDVREISHAGAHNLDATVDAVLELIDTCRFERRRGIAFITGSPGSGKTLAGLQVVHTPELLRGSEAAGVFLSGNMPLVEVITEALAISTAKQGKTKREAQREVKTFIQHAYAYRNEYAESPERVPPEHVVLFDEAQRAWDAQQVTRWTKGRSTRSEPQTLLDVMNRVPDWAVVIALVGSGQEINRGEASLSEWGRAIAESHPDWIVRTSPAVLPGATAPPGGRLFDQIPPLEGGVTPDPRLHLQMNVRSPRAERLNHWVDQSLNLDLDRAREAFPDPHEYPMVFTRDLEAAKRWLRDRRDGTDRAGLLASAEARRLRAWGLDTKVLRQERAWADWFLREPGDICSSNQLEVAATNFDCQGLEIDWAGVCWGNDLVFDPQLHQWRISQFRGSNWQRANEERSRFTLNGYRVLLTRARRGQVIWIPQPDGSDPTLNPADFDQIAALLTAVGVPSID